MPTLEPQQYPGEQISDGHEPVRAQGHAHFDRVFTEAEVREQQAAAEAKFRPELLPTGLAKSQLRRETLEAFFRMTKEDQDKVIAELQDTLANGAGIRSGQSPPPEAYSDVLETLRQLQMYSIERAVDRAVRRVIPEIILPIVGREIRRHFNGK